jgi:hypothetical protein
MTSKNGTNRLILCSFLFLHYMLNMFWLYYEKFQSPLVYLACDWLKNKIDLIFDLLVLEF